MRKILWQRSTAAKCGINAFSQTNFTLDKVFSPLGLITLWLKLWLLVVHRLVVSSSAGVRVVEVRGAGGVVLSSWQYPCPRLRTQFLVPVPSLSAGAQLLLAQDSNGNIIKVNLWSSLVAFHEPTPSYLMRTPHA